MMKKYLVLIFIVVIFTGYAINEQAGGAMFNNIISEANAQAVTPAPPIGGLVPCGRMADNLATGDIDESASCALCALFYIWNQVNCAL